MSIDSAVRAQRIGEFLVESGVLKTADIPRILEHGRETGLRFGDAAIDLGMLTSQQLVRALGSDDRADFFVVRAEYFPESTRSWIELEKMLHWGVLPLGFKNESSFFRRKVRLNLGCIQPSSSASDAEVLSYLSGRASEPVTSLRRYLVLPDHFLRVLEVHYGWSAEQVDEPAAGQWHPLLRKLLGG